ncbi:Phosphoinositide phosphatase SAC1 [Chlorella vulgaris]
MQQYFPHRRTAPATWLGSCSAAAVFDRPALTGALLPWGVRAGDLRLQAAHRERNAQEVAVAAASMHLTLYQTAQRLYVVRHALDHDGKDEYRVLKLDRSTAALDVCEDPTPYTKPQIQRLLAAINAGNQQHGGLQQVCEACAVVGVVQLLEGPYLLLITRKRYLGAICGHKVYGIEATSLVPVMSPAAHRTHFGSQHGSVAEQRYRKLLAGVQLTKDFFFSFSWPIHQTVQRTFAQPPGEAWADDAFDTKFVWNEYLTRPLREALGNSRFVVPLAHGCFQQRPLALLGRTLLLTLVARRSRQFAGTRYLKRGVTGQGYCANDVEVEQVLEAGMDWKSGLPLISSVVQVRGSIPLHWAQQPDSSIMKPEILLHRYDPLYTSTRRHFDQLREQYGEPVCVLDLVKRVERRPRESVLGREYATAVRFLNQRLEPGQQRIQYQAFDLSHRARIAKTHLLSDLQRLQEPVLQATGIFVSVDGGSGSSTAGSLGAPGGGGGGGPGCGGAAPQRVQSGVLRTNCIDSIDRTNVGQFTYGMLALGRQLLALGIAESAWLDPASSLARHLLDAYEAMGHTLALQYGGSEAHSAFFQRQRGDWEAATQSRDLLTSVRRFYSNTYTDAEKQDACNLFLGVFQPVPGKPAIWELGGDTYLHLGFGRALGRASGMGSRSSSFSAAAGHAGQAGGSEVLASFPPPHAATLARLGSPPPEHEAEAEAEAEHAAGLLESPSSASLVSISSDGSFAPTLSALVEGAAHQLPPLRGASSQESSAAAAAAAAAAASEPSTPRGGAGSIAAASQAVSSPPSPPLLARLPASRRSSLLSSTRGAAKLESLGKLLSRQPVAHVRLAAAPPAAATRGALGWLSPGKTSAQAAAEAAGSKRLKPEAASAAAAAAATVAAAGVEAARPGVAIPLGGLQRSNSDPSMASSLGPLPLPATALRPGAGMARGRRVTFDGATILGQSPARASLARHNSGGGGGGGGGGGLVRHRTAPSATLADLADSAGGGCMLLGRSSSAPCQQLLVMEAPADLAAGGGGGGAVGGMRRPVSYHSLAGLNLEGAAAAEESIKPQAAGAAQQAPVPTAKPPRRLSFPSFARLRAFGRKSPDGCSHATLDSCQPDTTTSQHHPNRSLLGPRPTPGGSSSRSAGAPEPLSMSAVVYGAEAVRRGVDTLGVVPAAVASCWLTGADPLAAMMEEQQRLRQQVARQQEALATPLQLHEERALLEQYAALMRPSWAFGMAAFTQGARQASKEGPAGPPAPPGSSQGGMAPPAPQPGLAF